jgi:hypothetical protein
MKRRSRSKLAVAPAALFLASLPAAHAQPFPPEVQVGADTIIDYEFDWGRDGTYCPACNHGEGNNRLSFIDSAGNVWIGHVDAYTGDFAPGDGEEELVDTNAMPVRTGHNGPEWMSLQDASALLYNRYVDGKPQNPSHVCVGFGRVTTAGAWAGGCMPRTNGDAFPFGTANVGDPSPMVSYRDSSAGSTNLYWRQVRQGAQAHVVLTGSDQSRLEPRWVAGTNRLLLTVPAAPDASGNVYRQIFLYSTSDGTLQQLTFEPTDKAAAYMWRAPEYDDSFVFFARVGYTEVDVYRYLPDAGGASTWQVTKRIQSTPDAPYIYSPEPFTYNGKSWIFFTVSSEQLDHNTAPSQLALSGIEPDVPTFRLLTTDGSDQHGRQDPEYYITANGPYIYYNRYIIPDHGVSRSEGVFRVDTGLGAPQ